MPDLAAHFYWARALLVLAYIVIFLGIVVVAWPYSWKSKWKARRGYFFMVALLTSVLLMESGYVIGKHDGNIAESIAESVSGAWQFFSLDAGYTELVATASVAFPDWEIAFYIIACVYTIIVPVVGGCFIVGLLYAFVPRFRLLVNHRRTKYVFSELNERSITLAENLAKLSWGLRSRSKECEEEIARLDTEQKKWLKSACIVFTDAYADAESESNTELMERAKRIGAICLKDDVLERSLTSVYPSRWAFGRGEMSRRRSKVVYFLMDECEESNLAAAVSLLTEKRGLWKRTLTPKGKKTRVNIQKTDNMEMYIFSRSEETPKLVENAFLRNCEQYVQKVKDNVRYFVADCDEEIIVKVIDEYRNLVHEEIFDDSRLSETLTSPFSGEEQPEEANPWYKWLRHYWQQPEAERDGTLQVAILGGGRIGKEFYKTTCWYAQMLAGVHRKEVEGQRFAVFPKFDVRIAVLAKNAKALEQELRFEMPELFRLQEKYCVGDFRSATFGSSDSNSPDAQEFERAFEESGAVNAKFILIVLGNDERNLHAARWVERKIKGEHGRSGPVMIYYVVENEDLCEILTKEDEARSRESGSGCVLKACGSLRSRLKIQNVYMSDIEHRALQAERMHSYGCRDGRAFLSGYNRDSSVATALHLFNKFFSIGIPAAQEAAKRSGTENEGDMFGPLSMKQVLASGKEAGWENQIYWLEHYRWCAYMLTQGFRCPSAKQFACMAFNESGDYIPRRQKDENLRLHVCLLESGIDYTSVEELLRVYARLYADPAKLTALEEKVAAIRSLPVGESLRKERVIRVYKESLLERIPAVKGKVVKMQKSGDENLSLRDWLDEIFDEDAGVSDNSPEGKKGEAFHPMDPLDKLSLLVTLCKGDTGAYEDFKSYDVKIVRNLYLDVVRQRVVRYLEKLRTGKEKDVSALEAGLKREVSALCKGWKGWELLFVGGLKDPLEYDAVFWTEEFEAILLKAGEITPVAMKNFTEACRASKLNLPFEDGGKKYLLVEVPRKGSVCVGSLTVNGEKYYLHLHRYRTASKQELYAGAKGRAERNGASGIQTLLLKDAAGDLKEGALVKRVKEAEKK